MSSEGAAMPSMNKSSAGPMGRPTPSGSGVHPGPLAISLTWMPSAARAACVSLSFFCAQEPEENAARGVPWNGPL
eukprot:13772384-Alexandrium_andersonii.AAC.1